MGKQQIIELNGKRYDARTGKIIDSSAENASSKLPAVTTKQPKLAKPMDGFSIPSNKLEKSKTLMRHSVKKPVVSPVKTVQQATSKITQQSHASKQLSPDKLAQAIHIPKSSLVSRYGHHTEIKHAQSAKNVSNTPQIANVQKIATASAVRTSPLEQGLANAISHEQVKIKRQSSSERIAQKLRLSPRMLSAGSLVLAGLLIGGFFAYQNVPNLNMRVASARSGVKGNLPGYQPAGFRISSNISAQPGQITVSYKSRTDDRNFKITQNSSKWDSESLLNNYVAVNRRDYQTVQDRGRTVYIYNNNNATWVDGGIWYRVEGNSQLNSEQLQSIANSL